MFVLFIFSSKIFAFSTIYFPKSEFYPQYQKIDGRAVGFLPEVAKLFFNTRGESISSKFLPVRRGMLKLISGDVDFAFPSNPSWGLKEKEGKQVFYSKPVMKSKVSFLVSKDSSQIEDKQLKVIGTIRGYTVTPFLEEIETGRINVIEADSVNSLLRLAHSNRVDAIYFHSNIEIISKNEYGLVPAKNLPSMFYEYHLSSINKPEVIEQFDIWLEANSDVIDELKRKYNIQN